MVMRTSLAAQDRRSVMLDKTDRDRWTAAVENTTDSREAASAASISGSYRHEKQPTSKIMFRRRNKAPSTI
jgi:hypothetical protein